MLSYDQNKSPVINYMMKVVDELKTQMQNIQYYSLLQKLFISYIFKHLEGQIDSVNKNSNQNNFSNIYKNAHQNKFNPQSGINQFPFFGPGGPPDMDFMSSFNQSNQEKDQMSFMKQMQNSGFNFANLIGNGNIPISSNLPGMPGGIQKMPSLDQSMLSQMQNNQFNNPMELLQNLHSSINCQINHNQGGGAAAQIPGFNAKPGNNSQQHSKIPQHMSHAFPGISGMPGNTMNIGNAELNPGNLGNSGANNSNNANVNIINNQQKNINAAQQMVQSSVNASVNNANYHNLQAQQQINNNNNSQNIPHNVSNNNNSNQMTNNQTQNQNSQYQNLFNLQSSAENAIAQHLKNNSQFAAMKQSAQTSGSNQPTNPYGNQNAFNPNTANSALFFAQGNMNIPATINPGINQQISQIGMNNAQNPSGNVNSQSAQQMPQAAFNGAKSGNPGINIAAGFNPSNFTQQQLNSMFQMFQNQQAQQNPDFQR